MTEKKKLPKKNSTSLKVLEYNPINATLRLSGHRLSFIKNASKKKKQ